MANKLNPIPNQFLEDNFSLNTITETIVDKVKILKLLIGNNTEGSITLVFKAEMMKYIVPKLIVPKIIPAGIACN